MELIYSQSVPDQTQNWCVEHLIGRNAWAGNELKGLGEAQGKTDGAGGSVNHSQMKC